MLEITKTENLSASDLLKKSAMQICYFRKKRMERVVSPGMIKGNEAAERKIISEFKEMRGTYAIDNLLIHYAFDEIIQEGNHYTLIEHKNIDPTRPLESWYLDYSFIQVALYEALTKINPYKEYFTAKFFRKQGYNTNYLLMDSDNISSVLYMGEDKYEVSVRFPKRIVDFYVEKAKSSFEYTTAKEWDAEWKFKEYTYLEKFISTKKITKHNG